VEEASFLPAVQRVVGGVQIDDDLALAVFERSYAKLQEQTFHFGRLGVEFVVTALAVTG
jgi:hypothetical protein